MYRLRSLIPAVFLTVSSLLLPAPACAYFHAHTAPAVNSFTMQGADADARSLSVTGSRSFMNADGLVVSPATIPLFGDFTATEADANCAWQSREIATSGEMPGEDAGAALTDAPEGPAGPVTVATPGNTSRN